jgi:hypothetical protein
MKTRSHNLSIVALWLATLGLAPAQGTAFTYQGRLTTNSAPYSGSAEFQFTLWDSANDGNAVATNTPASVIVTVAGGLFIVTLDFGLNSFNGQPRFLQSEVRTAIGPFTALNPRQPVTATPYALRALNLITNGLAAGTYGSAVTFDNAANSFAGAFNGAVTGNGAGLTNVNAAMLDGLGSAGFWKTNGNAGANPTNGAFLGTSDNLPLEFKVNGLRALRIEYATNSSFSHSPNLVGGYPGNIVSNGFVGAVIGGGGNPVLQNRVGHHFATVVGGIGNTASGFASTAMGNNNTASGGGATAMGYYNTASGLFSTAAGYGNTASGLYSTAIGDSTAASGHASIAMGRRAKALNDGAFVWADAQDADFASTASNQFLIRAQGGVGMNTSNPGGATLAVNGPVGIFGSNVLELGFGVAGKEVSAGRIGYQTFTAGALDIVGAGTTGLNNRKIKFWCEAGATFTGVITAPSDRKLKQDFQALDGRAVLDKVVALPVQSWAYTFDPSKRHFGPVAQDFHAAFGLNGDDDTTIATIDADGVALAAIQGLNQKVEEKEARITALEKELVEIKRLLLKQSNE